MRHRHSSAFPFFGRPALAAALLLAALATGAQARDHDRDHPTCKRDQDCARDALVQGEIKPLSAVLRVVREKVPGDIIEIELERERHGWIYEVKVLTPNGRRKKIDVDARTLELLKVD